jgi:hypothetical protein
MPPAELEPTIAHVSGRSPQTHALDDTKGKAIPILV